MASYEQSYEGALAHLHNVETRKSRQIELLTSRLEAEDRMRRQEEMQMKAKNMAQQQKEEELSGYSREIKYASAGSAFGPWGTLAGATLGRTLRVADDLKNTDFKHAKGGPVLGGIHEAGKLGIKMGALDVWNYPKFVEAAKLQGNQGDIINIGANTGKSLQSRSTAKSGDDDGPYSKAEDLDPDAEAPWTGDYADKYDYEKSLFGGETPEQRRARLDYEG